MSIDMTLKRQLTDYDVREIAKDVYKINEYNLTTMFLIVGDEKALAIDCGTGVGDYLSVLKKLTNKPIMLVCTHAHVDHIGGREQFDEMCLSEKDESIIKDVTVSARYFYIGVMKYLMFFRIMPWKKVKVKKVTKEPKRIFIGEGDRFDLGGKTVAVFETPGHTEGSLSYLYNEEGILFTGDVINPNNLMFLKHATSVEKLQETLKKIQKMPGVKTIWASHLSAPITRETLEDGISCAQRITKKKNGFPFILFAHYKEYVIIHLAHKRREKRGA